MSDEKQTIINHKFRPEWRAIHDPEKRTITYQKQHADGWVTNYTAYDWDPHTWFYTSDGWGAQKPPSTDVTKAKYSMGIDFATDSDKGYVCLVKGTPEGNPELVYSCDLSKIPEDIRACGDPEAIAVWVCNAAGISRWETTVCCEVEKPAVEPEGWPADPVPFADMARYFGAAASVLTLAQTRGKYELTSNQLRHLICDLWLTEGVDFCSDLYDIITGHFLNGKYDEEKWKRAVKARKALYAAGFGEIEKDSTWKRCVPPEDEEEVIKKFYPKLK